MVAPIIWGIGAIGAGLGLWKLDNMTGGAISTTTAPIVEPVVGAVGTGTDYVLQSAFDSVYLGWLYTGVKSAGYLGSTALSNSFNPVSLDGGLTLGATVLGAGAAAYLDRNETAKSLFSWSPWGPGATIGILGTVATIAAFASGILPLAAAVPMFAGFTSMLITNWLTSPSKEAGATATVAADMNSRFDRIESALGITGPKVAPA